MVPPILNSVKEGKIFTLHKLLLSNLDLIRKPTALVSAKMMMMNCFYDIVDQRKAFSLISSWEHCQRYSPSRISDTP